MNAGRGLPSIVPRILENNSEAYVKLNAAFRAEPGGGNSAAPIPDFAFVLAEARGKNSLLAGLALP